MKIDRNKVHAKYGGHCSYCGKEITVKEMQVVHIEPKCNIHYRDMPYDKIHNEDNLTPTCRRCNHYKRGANLEMFREMMKTIHIRIKEGYINKVALDFGIMKLEPFDGKFYFEKYCKQDSCVPLPKYNSIKNCF